MDADSLIVRAGDPVLARGAIVRASTGFALYLAPAGGVDPQAVYPAGGLVMQIKPAPDASDLAFACGWEVTLGATWDGDALADARVVERRLAAHQLTDSSVGAQCPNSAQTLGQPTDVATIDAVMRIREAEGPLWESGALIWRVANGTPVPESYLAAAHDPELVEAALRPVLGDTLRIVPSPWGREVYAAIDTIADQADSLGLVTSYVRGMGLDGIVRAELGFTRLAPEIALALRPIPDGVLALDTAVTPTRPA